MRPHPLKLWLPQHHYIGYLASSICTFWGTNHIQNHSTQEQNIRMSSHINQVLYNIKIEILNTILKMLFGNLNCLPGSQLMSYKLTMLMCLFLQILIYFGIWPIYYNIDFLIIRPNGVKSNDLPKFIGIGI